MLKQGRVIDVKRHLLSRANGYIAVVTRIHPRYFANSLLDKWIPELAPSRDLLDEFREKVHELDGNHNAGFGAREYDKKFQINSNGWEKLERLSKLSRTQDVYLVCHCKVEEMCHRELLLLLAEKCFGAEIDPIHNPHTDFRLSELGPPESSL